MSFWNQIKKWLNKEGLPVNSCTQPISHELIHRTDENLKEFEKWKLSPCRHEMLDYIANNYKIWKNTPCEQCDGIDFLKMKSFDGFIVHFMDLDKDCDEVRHLFDYLKQRIQSLGYVSYVSDVKEFEKTRWIEKVERHYLKPPLKREAEKKRKQRFGNINIELLFRDGEPLHMKFAACTYQDSQYEDAEDFGELVKTITS